MGTDHRGDEGDITAAAGTVRAGATSTAPGTAPAGTAPAGTAAAGTAPAGTAPAGTAPSRRTARARDRSGTARLAGGLVEVPMAPHTDPASAVLDHPVVAEGKRYCSSCGTPVGRSGPNGPGTVRGDCGKCGTRFDFTPMLHEGDVVADQYEVRGCLAHGGLGWIYLATDKNVSDRWVVLKGLLHSHDPEARAVAVAEREFLAELSHPSIVQIFNFVEHPGPNGDPVGYIVMEFVGGTTLTQLRGDDPMPLEQAIGYILDILPALGYMHECGLAYNDLKPENIMFEQDRLTLIDMGAVSGIGGYGYIYGTRGFQAPEILDTGPTPASDIFTVGRTLAVLTVDMAREKGTYVDGLPLPQTEPLFADHEFFYRLLLRCTDPDPDARYPDTAALARDLTGVLREIISIRTGTPHPATSGLFSPPRNSFGTGMDAARLAAIMDERTRRSRAGRDGSGAGRDGSGAGRDSSGKPGAWGAGRLRPCDVADALPVPLVRPEDPAAPHLAALVHSHPEELLEALGRLAADGPPEVRDSIEIPLSRVQAHLDMDQPDAALEQLDALRPVADGDWRCDWLGGAAALRTGEYQQAFTQFDTVLTALPGELAPKLAAAATAEVVLGHWDSDDPDAWRDAAGNLYRHVWRTDPSTVSAAFGMARLLVRRGDIAGGVAVLDGVPVSSRHHDAARLTAVLALLDERDPAAITEDDLAAAAARTEQLPEGIAAMRLRALTLDEARRWIRSGHSPAAATPGAAPTLLGAPFTARGLAAGAEDALRALARAESEPTVRYRLVDRANRVRPRTWL